MINVTWHNDSEGLGKCANCGQVKPHSAEITIPTEDADVAGKFNDRRTMLCSDCVEDLKKRLS